MGAVPTSSSAQQSCASLQLCGWRALFHIHACSDVVPGLSAGCPLQDKNTLLAWAVNPDMRVAFDHWRGEAQGRDSSGGVQGGAGHVEPKATKQAVHVCSVSTHVVVQRTYHRAQCRLVFKAVQCLQMLALCVLTVLRHLPPCLLRCCLPVHCVCVACVSAAWCCSQV